ncbi:MAG: DNA polymerase III subunit alpha [Geminicoccaceae bacterium]
MPHAPFVHLRVRSAYSLLEGSVRYDELVKECRSHAMPAVAVTDNGNLFGVMEFCAAAKKAGVQPIVGALVAVTPEEKRGGRQPVREPEPEHVVLLVKDAQGYASLLALMSEIYLDGDPSGPVQASLAQLETHAAGLILLTGGAGGPVGAALARGERAEARALLERLKAAYGDRLYVELQRHGLEREQQVEPDLVELAYALELPLVATNDVHFMEDRGYEAEDALICIAEGAQLAQTDRKRVTVEHRFKSAVEMQSLFADLPEAIANTLVVARRCAYMAPARQPILPSFPSEAGRSEDEELRVQARAGLEERLQQVVYTPGLDAAQKEERAAPYRARLEFELDVIVQMKFPGYFLIVSDFIQWAKNQGIPVGPGRGSGAGSVVAWALKITDLDPLRFGLLFERFLNPERVSMPDFDIDFCQDRRDAVIHYVQQRYGRDRVAHIITFGRLQARAVLRDVGRVLGLPFGQVDRLCKLVPQNPANPISLAQALELEPTLKEERAKDPEVDRMFEIALQLEGLPRNASTHAAGVVIGDRPLQELVPLYKDPRSGMPVTQFNMKDVEKAGLVKFDFLGLSTLTMLRTAESLVRESGTPIVLDTLPLDDRPTYELLSRAETAGVFQLESSGMRDALRKLKPDSFEDIIAMVSLYRPGPMDNIPRYTNVKHGTEEAEYLHDSLRPILGETNGVIIYQEQVMEIAKQLAGYTLGGADLLRRAMGKKIKAEMDAQREVFISGATGNGIPGDLASTIFDQVAKFASYGFNKSHAAAYALLAYQTAYLKANHPVEFFAAVMTIEMANLDKLAMFRREMVEKGVLLYPPDVNASKVDFAVEDGPGGIGVRYALAAIKGVGAQAMQALVAERERAGPFTDLFSLCARVGTKVLNKRMLESLIKAGALDELGGNRRQLCEGLDKAMRHAAVTAEEADSGQVSLFGGGAAVTQSRPQLEAVQDWPLMERLAMELDAVGFYMSAHPLDGYRGAMRKLGIIPVDRIRAEMGSRDQARLTLAGVVISKQERTTERSRFAFVQMSDATGAYEVTVWGDLLATVRELLTAQVPLRLDVDARLEGDAVRLIAQRIEKLDDSADSIRGEFEIRVASVEVARRLRPMLQGGEGVRGARVRLVVPTGRPGEEATLALPPAFTLRYAATLDIERTDGVLGVRELARPH